MVEKHRRTVAPRWYHTCHCMFIQGDIMHRSLWNFSHVLKVYTCVTCILNYSDFRGPTCKDSMWENVYVPALASSKHSSLWPFCLELGPDAWDMRRCLSIGPMAWRRKQMFIPLPSYFLSIIAASTEFERQTHTHTRARQSRWECITVCIIISLLWFLFQEGLMP